MTKERGSHSNQNYVFGTGKGRGMGSGSGQGLGRGRNKGGAFGPGGFCVCAKCGRKVKHRQGEKCTTLKCPDCGHTMIREELLDERTKKHTKE